MWIHQAGVVGDAQAINQGEALSGALAQQGGGVQGPAIGGVTAAGSAREAVSGGGVLVVGHEVEGGVARRAQGGVGGSFGIHDGGDEAGQAVINCGVALLACIVGNALTGKRNRGSGRWEEVRRRMAGCSRLCMAG